MKIFVSFLLWLIISFSLFSQNIKTLTFFNYGQPLADVKVYYQNQFITNSYCDGKCEIPDSINIVNSNYLGIFDTIINIKNCINCNIDLKINLLKEIEVSDNYDAKKHFLKLLEFSDNKFANANNDTTIYYRVFKKQIMQKLGKIELFEGIGKLHYNSKNRQYELIIVKIDNYYNDIAAKNDYFSFKEDSLYNKLLGFGSAYFNDKLSEKNRQEFKDKKYQITNIYQQNDSTIFKINIIEKSKKQTYTQQRNYYIFVNNTLKKVDTYFEYDKNHFNFLNLSVISKNRIILEEYDYNKNIFYKNYFYKSENFYPKIDQDVISEYYIENIQNPNLEIEMYQMQMSSKLKYAIIALKKQYPDLVIPSSP